MIRMISTTICGAIIGAIAGCVPAAAGYAAFWGSANGQFGMWIAILIVINATLGMVSGTAGGIMFAVKQGIPTAAAPCMGIVAGGIFSVIAELTAVGPKSVIWLAPIVGLAIGVLASTLTWRKNQL